MEQHGEVHYIRRWTIIPLPIQNEGKHEAFQSFLQPQSDNSERKVQQELSHQWVSILNGPSYAAFRSYRPEWHDQWWWRSRYNRIVFISGGWYYWNAGWWYPAWGYAPNAYYAYDGPIYGYNGLTPDQVIANVQGALQQEGYYRGGVDGMLGPYTREALANYQRHHGLNVTSAIDRPTLEALGMT